MIENITEYAGWKRDYALGIQEIDEQHKIVFEQIEELRQAIVHGDSHQHIGNIIERMAEYARIHLVMEECVLRMFAYTGYEAHKGAHEQGVRQIAAFSRRHAAGDREVALEFFEFIGGWWCRHILIDDARYVPTLMKKGAARAWLPGVTGLLRWRRGGAY
ncbi:bacteriohemerythrin [Acidihalobacter prosperus]|uniref:Hemerythrin-like domain-containing protein n=1 Tax=Acidihalobacter prosperus TaxID=160660 RepID=A0A1A6C7Q6_9GAMM|nr:bacteriohemerythrin [Acidihalobacter prosperus]OBS10580.1 hypothetical protein Thpro_020296 [Acidihalobacter prosperus]